MGDLFMALRRHVKANAHRAVEIYSREVPEYRSMVADQRTEAAIVDLAVFARRCTLERAPLEHPLSDDDLAVAASAGQRRGEWMLSLPSQQHVLGLHFALMLREIQDRATPKDHEDLLRLVGWVGPQGTRARAAYLQGYLIGVGRSRSAADRVGLLTRMLLIDEPVEPGVGDRWDMRLSHRYVVCVVSVPHPEPPPELRASVVETLLKRCRTPMTWLNPAEFVLLTPIDDHSDALPEASEAADKRALALAREVAAAMARPCSVGSATGELGALAETLASARRVSRAAPRELEPRQLWTDTDVFVELGVLQQPRVDTWLHALVERMAAGPELLTTLDIYYRNDMNRFGTASALRIHPRTLDYRLRRVRELTGMDPGSTQGVRVLTAAVMRALAGGWSADEWRPDEG